VDDRYLTAREQQLRERRRSVTEQVDIDQQVAEKEREIERLELEKTTLETLLKPGTHWQQS